MSSRFVHLFVLFVALLMPFQAFSMAIAMSNANYADANHCKHMQLSLQNKIEHNSTIGEHCKMHVNAQHSNPQSKQAPQKAACCLGDTCSALCAGLVLTTSLPTFTFNPTGNDFTHFVAPHFYSQSPDSLERPPRC